MKKILLSLLLAMATTSIAAEPSADYCDDQALWDQLQQLLADNPTDDSIVSLYAFRRGLCSVVFPVSVITQRATSFFEQMRNAGRVEL